MLVVNCYTNLMWSCTYLDPPRIPLKKGDFEKNLVPLLIKGDRNSMQPHKKLVLVVFVLTTNHLPKYQEVVDRHEWRSIAYLGYCWRYPRHILTRKIAGMGDQIYECNQETRYRRFNPECLLHKCLLSSIAHESRARSAQLVSPPPTVLVASEIQQEGCFPLSSKRLTHERSNPLSIACDFPKKWAASHSRAPALLCLLLMFTRSMRACGSN